MLVYSIENIKEFMSLLLKKDTFDNFKVRSVIIHTFTTFEIQCNYYSDFYLDKEKNPSELIDEKKYCTWKEVKSYVFDIVKGNRLPGYIKIIFSADTSLLNNISENASALFINVTFEKDLLNCTTGSSIKNFSLDKSVEYAWDEYVSSFFNENKIYASTSSY